MFDILLKRFRQLEILCLGAYHFRVTDSGLASLQKYPSKLRVLYLAYDNDVTDVGLAFIAFGCQFLSVISLRSCSITESGFEVLTKSCNLLEQVDLDGCNEIHDAGIWSLNQNCRKLRALNISGCLNIRGETFQGCSPELAYLEARYCRLHETGVTGILSGGGIEYLNLSFPQYGLVMNGLGFAANLKSLNLRGCKSVDDIAIMEISKGCLLLEELDVSSCDNFCDRGLQALGNGCKRLKMIWMESCDQLTRRGIRKFKRQRADVQINAQSDDNKATTMALDWTSTSRFQLHP